ncbi:SsrA-binding protein SmpB [Candidatus Rhabdochlamydia porcellionis]|jgi:SsrA-binding protein|uniref:SsrA-binding protein n=1 Tax=Candidatus Rhabdochlamydia porcellionis TaxID=225148 RepID=A0ABX8YZI3_9BACT|nr:SsrA-binding protein SmpB [Candidatus Rhabdochlamydia porcellionis]QZA58786.1 SsrA-binding protein [Candidatus Rhabdochlamydia porcellionis]
MSKHKESELVSNRRAFYDYEIIETFEAGIILSGTEVKSLRDHGGSLSDAYILISQQEKVLLKNASIAPYRFGNIFNHEDKRDRFLLLHKREIMRLKNLSQEKGFTLIPLSMYLKNGFVKVKVACAKGKKNYDKRQALKEKEHTKTIQQAMRNRID